MKTNTPLQNLVGRVADRLSPRGDSSAPAEKSPRPLVIESLEPRIMFSGSPAPAPAPAPESSPAEAPAVQESTAGTAPEAASPVPEDSAVAAPPAGAESAPSDAGWGDTAITLTDTELAALTEAASMIWAASGISGEQASALASARYQIADLGGRVLGSAEGDLITIDDDAAGRGWFVDGTPEEDSEFAPGGTATTGVDLLSAVLHEQGHLLGLEDSSVDRADIMFELIGPGERRLPVAGEAAGAIAGSLEGAHMLTLAPATEDFEDEASGSSVFSDDGNPGGPEFTLAVGADQSPGAIFETFKDGSGYGTGGSNGLLDTFVPGNTLEGGEVGTITIESGWSFEVNSIDVAVADSAGTPGGSETVIFTGTVAGGSTTVTESIVVDSSASDWNTVDFTGTNFEGVQLTDLKVSLPASPSAGFLFFDDFNYTADDGATPPPPPPPSDSILAVDFNSGGSPTEAGFVGQSAASFTHTTAEGALTVAISDQQGNFDRGVPATHGTHTDIYRDFFFDNSNQLTLTLSGAAISANTDYDITFYAFDEAENNSVTFTGVSGTSGSAGPISYTADADITSLDQFAAVGTFTSDGSGVLTINSSTTRPRINGFEIDATPPPPPPPDGGHDCGDGGGTSPAGGVSDTAPVVDGADIAELTTPGSRLDKTWTDTANHGQTFTTGSNAEGYFLNSFTLQTSTAALATKTYNVRVGEVIGGNVFATIYTESIVISADMAVDDYLTFEFATPVSLDPDKVYGADIEMTASTTGWPTGIPYLYYNNTNTYTGGDRYTRADGDPATITVAAGTDRVFHLDLEEVSTGPGTTTALFSDNFETPDVATNAGDGFTTGTTPTGWVRGSVGFGGTRHGITDEAGGDFTDPCGEQAYAFRYTNSGITTAQGAVGTFASDTTYTISFDVVRDDGGNAGLPYIAEFVAFLPTEGNAARAEHRGGTKPGTILGSSSGNASNDGLYTTVSFTVNADDFVAEIGNDIGLRFIGATTSAIIDNVQITATTNAAPPSANIATYIGTNGAANADTWNTPGNWENNIVPIGTIDAVIDTDRFAVAESAATPAYEGRLTLNDGATLKVWTGAERAYGTGTITMGDGSRIIMRQGNHNFGDIVLTGDAKVATGESTTGHHTTKNFDGAITGDFGFTISGVNNNTINFNTANTFSRFNTANDFGGSFRVNATADGALGTGDVTIGTTSTLEVSSGLSDTIGDDGALKLFGSKDSRRASKLILGSNETVAAFFIDGVDQGAGTFGAIGSGADNELAADVISGGGILTVTPLVTPSTLDAVDDDYTTTNPTDEDTVLNISAPGVLANDSPTSAPATSAALITGVTIEDASSFYAPDGRLPEDTINQVGLNVGAGTHNNDPKDMWLSNNEEAPVITFDLEGNYDLGSFHVWNYNEHSNNPAAFTARGANEVEILVAEHIFGEFTSLGTFNFAQADGTNTYAGEDISLTGADNVRLIRFDIKSDHGGDNFTGLSEVQFFTAATPATSGATISASDTTSANGATVNVNPDGSFDYDPTGSASIQALDAGDALTDTFTYTVADGMGNTDTATVSIAVDGLNDAPVLAGANDFDTVSEDDTANGGQMVSEIAGGFITDADGGSVEGIAITAATSSSAAGTWQFSTDGGGSWADVGAVSETSGLLLRDSDLVRYLPDGTGVANGSITFKAWDQTGGTSGGEGTKVTTLPDGSTEPSSAFSADTATSDAEVTEAAEANSAPVLTGANDFDPVSEDDVTNMGQPVVELVGDAFGDFITDADTGSVEGIAITGATSSSAAGTFQFSTDGGGVWTDVGAVSETSGLLLRDSDLVRYLPDGTGVAAGSITFKAWDQTGSTSGGEGTKVTTLPDGSTEPSSAFSADTATSGAEVVEAVDADVFVGGGTLTYREVAGRSDVVTIYSDGTNLIIHDDAGPVTAENPSWQVDANTVSVPLSDFEDILFEANDLDDTITVGDMPGFDGSLTIDGGEGFDTVTFAGGMTLALGTGTQNGTDENLDVDAETVKIDLEASLSVVGGGTIDITAAGGGAEDFVGIHLRGASLSSEGGAITLEGEGGSSGNHNDGVQLSHGSSITTGGGSVSITGTATGVAGPNDGVSLVGGSDITVGGAGTITITGTSSGVNDSYGVLLLTGTELTSGAGEVSVTGSSASTGPRNSGVYTNGATVTSAGGSITLDGSGGGSGGGGDNKGLRLTATTIGAGGSGGVTLTGTGGSGTSTNVGVEVGVRTEVTTASGDIVITGTGGAGTGVRNRGAEFQSDSRVISGGSLTIAGTSGGGTAGNEGVYGLGATLETTGSGALAIVGTGGGSADQNTGVSLGRTAVAGAGDVSIRGTGSVVSSGRYNDGVSLTTVGVTAGGDLLVVGDGGTGGDNNRGVYGNRVTIEAASYEILGRAHAATTGGGNAGVSFSNSTFSDTGTISGTGGGGTGPGNYGVYLHNVSSGMPVGNATGTAEDEDEETGGNYFNVVLPALVLAAGADRVGRKRRGQLAGLIGRLGESAAGEGEMEIYRESDGVIGLEATLATVASLEAAGVGVPDPSGEARRILVLTGDGGVFARLDAAGKLLSASPLARGPAAGAAGLIESLGGGGRGGWSQSPRATTPVPGRSFGEVFGIE